MAQERLFDTEILITRESIFDPRNDKVLIITDKNGRFDRQYLLSVNAFGGGAFIPLAEKGAPGGVPPLGPDGIIPIQYLPDLGGDAEIDDTIISLVTTWSSFKIVQELDNKADVIHADTHIVGGTDIIDGDNLEISYIPTNYIRDIVGTEAISLESLAAHLKGIDTKLANTSPYFEEVRIVTGLEESTKTITTAFTVSNPTSLEIFPKNGIRQFYGDDFTVSGNNILWTGLGLDGVLTAGDKIFLRYK